MDEIGIAKRCKTYDLIKWAYFKTVYLSYHRLNYSWTRAFELVTRGFELTSRGLEIISRVFELVSREFAVVTRKV